MAPIAAGAQLESSKVFCKNFFAKYNIPTAAYGNFTEIAPALAYLDEHPAPIVIKASGLAAGKGVIMAETQDEAIQAVEDMLEGDAFGSSKEIVIEETLYGEEASIHVIASGEDFICLLSAKTIKERVKETPVSTQVAWVPTPQLVG